MKFGDNSVSIGKVMTCYPCHCLEIKTWEANVKTNINNETETVEVTVTLFICVSVAYLISNRSILLTCSSQSKQEEEAVDISGGGEEQTFVDQNIQYQFRPEGSQVTYRVVAVTDPQLETRDNAAVSGVSTATFTGAPQNTFGDVISPGGGEARFTYFPATAVTDGGVSVHTTSDPSLTPAGGQFYVMMSPSDVIPTAGRNLMPHAYSPKMEGARTPRDQKRRAQHNEVERRRRDKINNWIVSLSQIIPDCTLDSTKTGASKGGILSKACDYITDLQQKNQQLADDLKEVEHLQTDNQLYRQQVEELRSENALLRAQLQHNGIQIEGDTPPQ